MQDLFASWGEHHAFYLSSLHSSSLQLPKQRKCKARRRVQQAASCLPSRERSEREARYKAKRAARLLAERAAVDAKQEIEALMDKQLKVRSHCLHLCEGFEFICLVQLCI